MTTAGKFYGIGVGPGDPELLTRKAARLLAEVDLLYVPAGPTGEPGFAEAILANLEIDPRRLRRVQLSMARQRDVDVAAYARAAQEIAAELRGGSNVAWITEGDPLFYSTFGHVWAELRRRAPDVTVEIVPGITSFQAAAARAQMAIAQLEDRVAVVPAAYGLHRMPYLLENFATVFLLKVHKIFDQLLDTLAALPAPPSAYYVERVGTAEERVVRDLASLRGAKLPYFSLVMLRRNTSGDADGR